MSNRAADLRGGAGGISQAAAGEMQPNPAPPGKS